MQGLAYVVIDGGRTKARVNVSYPANPWSTGPCHRFARRSQSSGLEARQVLQAELARIPGPPTWINVHNTRVVRLRQCAQVRWVICAAVVAVVGAVSMSSALALRCQNGMVWNDRWGYPHVPSSLR